MLPVQKTQQVAQAQAPLAPRAQADSLRPCPQCGNAKLPHCACDNCGYVNPKLALQMEQEAP